MKKNSFKAFILSNLIVILLIIAATTVGLSATAQSKKAHYYEISVKYKASDSCAHENVIYREQFTGSPTWNGVILVIKRYVKPYKLNTSSFEIIGIKRSTKAVYKMPHNEKFKPCDQQLTFPVATITFGDTTKWNSGLILNGAPTFASKYNFVYQGSKSEVTFSPPDSSGIVTMKIHGLTKLNDSTFTFKKQ